MNPALRFVLTGTQGGGTRLRVLKVLDERAQNTSQLAEALDVSQPTLDHHLIILQENHLTILQENGLIEKRGADADAPYQITRQTRADWDDVEELLERVEKPATPLLGTFMV